MATNSPAFRLTIFAPRIEDATESTVLTPVSGAGHTDPFVVTTIQGVTGAKAYLETPKGRQGGFDPVTRGVTTGNLTVSVFDPRTTVGGANASRWVTAYIGTIAGDPRLKGCKAKLERSLNGGTSWAPYFAGRVRNVSLNGAQRITLDLVDGAGELGRMCFLGVPMSATGGAIANLSPAGSPAAFGDIGAVAPLAATLNVGGTVDYFGNQYCDLVFDMKTGADVAVITKVAHDYMPDDFSKRPIRMICKLAAGGAPFAINGSNRFGWLEEPISGLPSTKDITRNRWRRVYGRNVSPVDPQYTVLPGGATAVTVSITIDQPPTPELPLLVNDVHPVQLWADIIDGKYSLSPGYQTLRPIGTRDVTVGGPWDLLLTDPSFGACRFIIDKSWKANEFIEQQILLPFGLGCVIDPQGRIQPIDLRRIARTPVATFTDADVVEGQEVSWSDSRDGAVTGVEWKYYVDRAIKPFEVSQMPDQYPSVTPLLLQTTQNTLFVVNDLSTLRDVGERIVKIDSLGSRLGSVEVDAQGQAKRDTVTKRIENNIADYLAPFQSGTLRFKVPYRMSSASGIVQGQFISAAHSKLPNPGTNARGGARLALVTGRSEQEGVVTLECLDYGAAATAAVPAITGVVTDASSPNVVRVTVTANAAGDQVGIWAVVTDQVVVTRPVDTAAGWAQVGTITGAGNVLCGPFPRGKRIWFRARSQAIGATVNAPSGWVYAPAPGYLDLSAPTAPSALTATNLYANRVDLSWVAGDATLDVDVFNTPGGVPGTWTDAMKVATYVAGSTTARVGFLAGVTQYTAGVRVRDASGGPSAMATVTYTTTSTLGVAPDPLGIDLVVGGVAP